MTIRRPAAFMAARSSTDRGRASALMRVQFSQLSLPKVSGGQPRMGNDKVALVHPPGAELDDIQIQRPWSPVFAALPSSLSLYLLTRAQQTTGVQARLE